MPLVWLSYTGRTQCTWTVTYKYLVLINAKGLFIGLILHLDQPTTLFKRLLYQERVVAATSCSSMYMQ